jgi:hypothetical protein
VNGEKWFIIELASVVLANVIELSRVRHDRLDLHRLDTLLHLLHDILVLQRLDVGFLSLHVRVEERARL